MNEAKIRLSKAEMELVENAEVILTKNAILQKAMQLLGELQNLQEDWIKSHITHLPEPVKNSSPKISRGENYLGLPYLVLDYPRCFEQEGMFIMRSMFWWGNFFSITLQLSGSYARKYADYIANNRKALIKEDYYLCTSDDPWQHHFREDNYTLVSEINAEEFKTFVTQKPFIKLAKKIPLRKWEEGVSILMRDFETLLKMLV